LVLRDKKVVGDNFVRFRAPLHFLEFLSYEQKFQLELNPDRADVIIPATRIYLNAMKWVVHEIFMFLKLDFQMEL
jgi:hypothetical protein